MQLGDRVSDVLRPARPATRPPSEASWPALSDGRTGDGDFGCFLMVLVDLGSVWSFSYDFGHFLIVFSRFRPVRGTGERANGRANPPRAQAS